MTQGKTRTSSNQGERSFPAARASSGSTGASRVTALPADRLRDEVESVARIGSYSLDIPSGRWVSSKGLDAIYGIDAAFERSIEGWTSLIHPVDREAMVAYFTAEVLGHVQPFDRQYRIARADTGADAGQGRRHH